jgi:hypothetical protein
MVIPPLLEEIHTLIAEAGDRVRVSVAGEVEMEDGRLPLHAIALGSSDPTHPALGVFGGVHGLERIGTEVVLAFLRALLSRLRWDASLQSMLSGLRIVCMPLVNPGGLLRGTRANPRGVDLMRNAPIECTAGAAPWLGGQRLGPALPWYRGALGEPLQVEAQALCHAVQAELLSRDFAISVDCHSGFGLTDRIWFPYACSREPIEHVAEMHALSRLLDDTLVHHRYRFEPQSRHYLAHGDLWDHLYRIALSRSERVLLPLTLEMGSWLWIKKNPRQVFSRQGLFNPLIAHRQQRVLRTHVALLDFLARAAYNHARWRPGTQARHEHRASALACWYGSGRTAS